MSDNVNKAERKHGLGGVGEGGGERITGIGVGSSFNYISPNGKGEGERSATLKHQEVQSGEENHHFHH